MDATGSAPKLSTNLDVEVHIDERRAGIERGRFTNDWVRCGYEIKPKRLHGVEYAFTFVAEDDVCEVGRRWRGEAATRDKAKEIIVNTLTQHIAAVAARRQHG